MPGYLGIHDHCVTPKDLKNNRNHSRSVIYVIFGIAVNCIVKKTIKLTNLVYPSGKFIRRNRVFGAVWIFCRHHTITTEN